MMAGNTFKRAMWESVESQEQPPTRKTWTDFNKEQQYRAGYMNGFNCLHYGIGHNEDALARHEMPDKDFLDSNCPDGLRAELMFPTCWNGELDSDNHQDHVAYPTSARNGPCPEGFEQRLPALFFETIYQTPLFKDFKGQFIFANGDPTGFGYHGDFISAWEGTVLQDAIDNPRCTNGNSNGEQSACPVLEIKSDDEILNCKMETPEALQKENLDLVERLPGNVAVAGGPGWAPMPSHPAAPAPTASASNSSASSTNLQSPSGSVGLPTPSSEDTALSPTAPFYSNTSSTSEVPSESVTAAPTVSTPTDNVIPVTSTSTDASGAVVQWVVLEDIETTTVYVDTAGRPTQPPAASVPTAVRHPVKRHRHKHVRSQL